MALSDAPRIVVTTFPPDGEPVASVEWVVAAGDRAVGFWTPDDTEWAERLASGDVVTVREASGRGKVDRRAPLLEGRAELLREGALFEAVREATRAKYGMGATAAELIDRVKELGGTKTPEAVVIIDVVG